MGWRAAKASGGASMPVSEGGSFAEGFASSFVPMFNNAVSSYADEQKEKRILELKEELYRKRESIKTAKTASTDASKLAKEEAKLLRIAQGVASSLGISPTQSNLTEVIDAVRANDGDGSQATNYLQERMSTGLTVFESGTVAPNTGAAPAPLVSEEAEPEVDDTGAALETTSPDTDAVSSEMSSLTGAGLMSAETEGTDNVQVASLNADAIMAEVATGGLDATSKEAGEKLAVQVADASGNVEGAENLTYDSPELSTANTQQRAGVLKFTGSVTPINELTDEDTINANLIALEGRTDSFAVDYRRRAQDALEGITDLPDIATMERSQRQAYIDGGWRQFEGKVPEENLMAHLQRATKFQQSGQAMPPLPATLDEQEALIESINAGVYGPVENIPANYTANLNTLISKNKIEEQLGDSLSVPNLLNSSLEDLDALQSMLKAAGIPNSTVTSFLKIREEQEKNDEFLTYSDGVTTSAEAINSLSRAENSGASEATINALEELRVTLTNRENERAARDNGIVVTPTMAIIKDEDGNNVVREVLRNADGTYTNADGATIDGVRPVSETFVEQWSSIETEHSTIIKKSDETLIALSQGLRNATTVLSVVDRNPDVLTTGGDVAQIVTSGVRGATSVLGVVNSLMKNKGEDYVLTADALDDALVQNGLVKEGQSFTQSGVDALVSDSVQQLASDTSIFEGQMILLAFRMGALEGQSGNAMSNKDFDRLMSIISSSNGNEDTFRAKLHEYMSDKIRSYDDRAALANKELDNFEETFGVTMSDIAPTSSEFVQSRGDASLSDSYQFFSNPMVGATDATSPPPTADALESLINNATAVKTLQANYRKLADRDDGTLDSYIQMEASRLGVSVTQLTKIMQQQGAD